MNAQKLIRYTYLSIFAVLTVLLSACQPAIAATTIPQPTQPAALPSATPAPLQPCATTIPATATAPLPTAPTAPTVTAIPAQPTQSSEPANFWIGMDKPSVAQNVLVENLSMPTFSWWVDAPQYRRITLQGYPVTDNARLPRIYIYPVAGLSGNTDAANTAENLQALLQTRKAGDRLPFLPLIGDVQVMHPQMQYLDFKNGKGVRFLTQYNNGMAPINNHDLIYTFQGLTNDGKYYVAAVLPVSHPDLPVSSTNPGGFAKAGKDYQNYVTATASLLDQKPANSFTPDLAKLDALVRSIEVK